MDGATQQRALLRSSSSHFNWEQKVVIQVIKYLVVNDFISWRLCERKRDLLQSAESFHSVDRFRNNLNKVQ